MNGIDWKVREGYVRDAFPLQLPAVLGIVTRGENSAGDPGGGANRRAAAAWPSVRRGANRSVFGG